MILIVDDNPINQKVFQTVLRTANYDADVAADGAQAVERFSSLKPDLILMDVSMPVMDGYDATRAIRSLEDADSRHTPIIACTALTAEADKKLCFQSGMDDYISKPVKPEHLLSLISSWLDDSKGLVGR